MVLDCAWKRLSLPEIRLLVDSWLQSRFACGVLLPFLSYSTHTARVTLSIVMLAKTAIDNEQGTGFAGDRLPSLYSNSLPPDSRRWKRMLRRHTILLCMETSRSSPACPLAGRPAENPVSLAGFYSASSQDEDNFSGF